MLPQPSIDAWWLNCQIFLLWKPLLRLRCRCRRLRLLLEAPDLRKEQETKAAQRKQEEVSSKPFSGYLRW